MKRLAAAIVAIPLALSGCEPFTQAVSTVCAEVAQIPSNAAVALDAQDPHSVLGVLWADLKSGCANGVPATGVSTDWTAMILGEVKMLIPQMLPYLAPYLVRWL